MHSRYIVVLYVYQECLPKKMGIGREVLRGRRTYCTVQVDFVDLPANHRLLPVWETTTAMVVRKGLLRGGGYWILQPSPLLLERLGDQGGAGV